MPPINLLIKPASGLCSMRCDYCFYYDEAAQREQASYGMMSEKTLKNVMRKTILRAEGSCTLAFQGGEPTLVGLPFYEKVIEYANQYNRRGIRINYALQTNGYTLTDEWCRFFADHHFLIGVSVDGLPEIHNKHRRSTDGRDTWERIQQSIKLLDQYHVDYNILTVVHRDTAQAIESIYRAYRRRGWNYLQFITCLDPLNQPRGGKPWSLTPEIYGSFLSRLFDLWYADVRAGNAPYIRQFDNYVGILAGFMPESCEQHGICGMQYTVEADGSVYPCDFYCLDQWKLGNFNEVRLDEIDEKRKNLRFIERSIPLPEDCRKCRWLNLCRGACFRSREEDGKNYFCEGYKKFFENSIDRMQELAEKY